MKNKNKMTPRDKKDKSTTLTPTSFGFSFFLIKSSITHTYKYNTLLHTKFFSNLFYTQKNKNVFFCFVAQDLTNCL